MKKIFCLLIVVITLFVSCCCVSAAEISPGSINQEALDYLTGCVKKLEPNTDYFLYRVNDTDACLIYSNDLYFDSTENVVGGSNVTKISYTFDTLKNCYVTTFEDNLSSFQLNSVIYSVAYSSLGHWSTVEDKNTSILTYILWTLVLLLLLFVGFKFFRNRRSYIKL